MVWTDEQQRRYEERLAYYDANSDEDYEEEDDDDEPYQAPVVQANSVRLTRLDASGNPIPGSERSVMGHVHFTVSTDETDAIQRAVAEMSRRLAPLAQAMTRLGQVNASRGTHDGRRR